VIGSAMLLLDDGPIERVTVDGNMNCSGTEALP
jgi:hypothetical protein